MSAWATCSPATLEHTHTQYCYPALREEELPVSPEAKSIVRGLLQLSESQRMTLEQAR